MAVVSFTLLSLFSSFLNLISQASAQPYYLQQYCTNDNGNYTANSTYKTNLNTLLSNLSSNTDIKYGFYNFSYGQNSDKVNAIGLCRGDLEPDVCRSCLNESRVLLTQKCPNQKEAIVYYEYCMLRYSIHPIFGIRDETPLFTQANPSNLPGTVDQFNQVLNNLMRNLSNKASSGDSRRKFAASNASAGFQTIFGLAQCTPDLPYEDCEGCLLKTISQLTFCCNNKIGAKVITPSCRIRYEIYPFYNTFADEPAPSPPPQVSPPPPSTNKRGSDGNNDTLRIVTAAFVTTVAMTLLLVFIYIYSRIRKSKENYEVEDDADEEIKTTESLQFHFDTIKVATDNLLDANELV